MTAEERPAIERLMDALVPRCGRITAWGLACDLPAGHENGCETTRVLRRRPEPSAVEALPEREIPPGRPETSWEQGYREGWNDARRGAIRLATEKPRQRPPEPSAVEPHEYAPQLEVTHREPVKGHALRRPEPSAVEEAREVFTDVPDDAPSYRDAYDWIDNAAQGLWKAANAHVAKVEAERDAILDALADVVGQACERGDEVDSMAVSAYADGMRLLAEHGRLVLDFIDYDYGRRVIGHWPKP